MSDKIRTLMSLHQSEDRRSYVTVYRVRVLNPDTGCNLTEWYDIDIVIAGNLVHMTFEDTAQGAWRVAEREVYRLAAFDGLALRFVSRTDPKFQEFLKLRAHALA